MKSHLAYRTMLAFSALTITAPLMSATINVPTQQPTIAAAITAAVSGDEIRVRSNHIESSDSNVINGKALSIRSYDAAFATPQPGAQWVLATGGGGTGGGLMQLQAAASLDFDGFTQVTVPGGNAFNVGTSCTLLVNNCTFSGVTLSNAACVKADAAAAANVTIRNCTFTSNGRSIWYNNVTGTTSLTVDASTFSSNSSYPVEFRTMAGAHTFNMTGCTVSHASNSPTRLYFFGTAAGNTTSNTVNIDRCKYTMTGTASNPIIVGGFSDAASPSSTATITLTNCLMDLRAAAATASAIGCLSDQPNRKSDITMRHCTVVQGNVSQSGVYLFSNTYPGSCSVHNSIIDGPGAALKNDGPGTMTSGKNLLNTAASITSGTGTASIVLSGTEITGASPAFVNAGLGDFRLSSTSPAADVAVDLGVATDIDGNARPVGTASDLGAFEQALPTSSVRNWEHYF